MPPTDPSVEQTPFGSWPSPLSAVELTAAGTDIAALGSTPTGELWWQERRPSEGGRVAIVTAGGQELPAPWNARSRVHEYGGGAVLAVDDGFVFVQMDTQQLYRWVPGTAPIQLTDVEQHRFADCCHDVDRQRLIGVGESHATTGPEPENFLTAIDLASGAVSRLAAGADFYAQPRVSPNGRYVSWLEWDHPNMPWDTVRLMLAPLAADGTLGAAAAIVDQGEQAPTQPIWLPDGRLLFCNDPDGWWNLFVIDPGTADSSPRCVYRDDAEYGAPLWSLDTRSFVAVGEGADLRILANRIENGSASLVQIDPNRQTMTPIASSHTRFGQFVAAGERVFCIAESPTSPGAVIALANAASAAPVESIRVQPAGSALEPADISIARHRLIAPPNGAVCHAWVYPPVNSRHQGPDGERPPLMVMTHGGPTGAASQGLDLRKQYYTTRGWMVLDLNYRGSTGFGRAYRDALRGQWGIADVADAAAAVQALVDEGAVDPERVAIRGGSAGGYTTLAALAFTDVFKAGASHYGIGDLSALARDTHKFEARYLDGLVGPWPAAQAVYDARSPERHADQFTCPVAFFQGEDDKVVPPNQTLAMADALRQRHIPVACVLFPGEGHGFRDAANVRRAIEGEYAFMARVFGFEPAEPLPPIEISDLAP